MKWKNFALLGLRKILTSGPQFFFFFFAISGWPQIFLSPGKTWPQNCDRPQNFCKISAKFRKISAKFRKISKAKWPQNSPPPAPGQGLHPPEVALPAKCQHHGVGHSPGRGRVGLSSLVNLVELEEDGYWCPPCFFQHSEFWAHCHSILFLSYLSFFFLF